MQTLKFISVNHGIAKKSGKPYDFTKVSDGVDSFLLDNAPGIREQITELGLVSKEEFECEVHIGKNEYGEMMGTIVRL